MINEDYTERVELLCSMMVARIMNKQCWSY